MVSTVGHRNVEQSGRSGHKMALSEFNGDKYQELEDEKSLLATMGIVVKELALKCPNDQELGKEVRELIKKYKLNTDVNG